MKKIGLILLLVIGFVSNAACQVKKEGAFLEYKAPASRFTMLAPNWNTKNSGDKLNVMSLRRDDKQCYFDLNVAAAPLQQYREMVRNWMAKKDASIVSGNPLVYDMTTPDGKYAFRTRTKGLYCDGKTYFASSACLRSNSDDDMTDRVFNSMRCGETAAKQAAKPPVQEAPPKQARTPGPRSDPKLGMIVSPEKKFSFNTVKKAYRVAREGGAEITRHYIDWGSMEKKQGKRSWKGNDYIVDITRDSGMRVSLTFLIIRTAILGALPTDVKFKGWDDPVFTKRFTTFVLDYIDRYGDVIDYVEIGAEVNAYFSRHPDELDAYAAFYKTVYDAIKVRFPRIKVGTVLAYHEMRNASDFSAYHKLNIGDFVGFTLYIYGDNYAFDRDPGSVRTYLDEISDLTAGRQFALEEVGWSPWPSLKGSEQSQKKAVSHFFDFFETAPPGLEFMNWFILYDSAQSDCEKIASSFVKRGSRLAKDKKVMAVFTDFLCHLGLRANDGTPRAAWSEYTERARRLGK